ncbi:AI-2E family transporter [Rhodohalobacter sp. SW132]|uniref:AI-2E family transporter n=1 Tax=Rhodohalobacter sp. SW132 TaxID=2293433 RepID=UPI000E361DC7|nr:AI-2E family transporter [Rhodohalobacter sp. SW132]REL32943.1 AI-2E family transporter [Rhodohalobacter sp. SW132]
MSKRKFNNLEGMRFLNKANRLLIFLAAVLLFMYYLASFLIPLAFGIFLAMLIVPFSNFLEKHKFNRVLSSLVSTFTLFIISGIFFFLFFLQINEFAEELPSIEEEIRSGIEYLQKEVADATGESQHNVAGIDTLWEVIETRIAGFIGNILEVTFQFLLVFVYTFLFLLYRGKLMTFIISMYSPGSEEENAKDALSKISKVVFHYLWGRLQVMLSLAIMYYITFLIFGLPYALLLTLFAALVTIIPYIGPLISGILPITFALIFFNDFYQILFFTICVIIIQLIESYVLEPYLIGKEVELNALSVIVAVLLGGIIWGVAGMILFVPIFATIKIISNHSGKIQPLGTVLGN